jgi:glutarate dioxygenase
MGFLFQSAHYSINPHPDHQRLLHIKIKEKALKPFLDATQQMTEQHLSYVPYLRLIAADALNTALGDGFSDRIQAIVSDRATGGFTLSVLQALNLDQQVALGTAVSHLIGIPNFDDMSNKFYAIFEVRNTDTSDSYLRQAYRLFTLHTDGTYVTEPTRWILMMKMAEEHAIGGESRLLHLDDWDDLNRFAQDPLAHYAFDYKSPPSKNYSKTIQKTTFFERNGHPCVCFIDQFVYPETIDEAKYLNDLSASMEASAGTVELPLPVNHLVVLNNDFWLHGRAPFEKHPNLSRTMMRQRGYFRQGEMA